MREETRDNTIAALRGVRNYLIAYGIISLIVIGVKSCKIKNESEKPEPSDVAIEEVQEGDIRAYNPEEHYVTVEIPKTNEGPGELVDYSIPEGYDVYSINPYTKTEDDKVIEEGFAICYVNKEPVVVYATYDENIQAYEFNTFGYIVETQKTKQYNN